MSLAGLPPTTEYASTSLVTTAPAATVDPSPMVMPGLRGKGGRRGSGPGRRRWRGWAPRGGAACSIWHGRGLGRRVGRPIAHMMMAPPPIQQSSPITMGLACSRPCTPERAAGSTSCPTARQASVARVLWGRQRLRTAHRRHTPTALHAPG